MGVGILIGMQLDGPPTAPGGDAADGNGDVTPIPADGTPNRTPIPTASPPTVVAPGGDGETVTIRGRTTVPGRRFDEAEIAREVKELINERRRSAGLEPFRISGSTISNLDDVARSHSIAMADAGYLRHNLEGRSSADRYRDAGLFETCKFPSDQDSVVVDATGNRLEVNSKTAAGRAYADDGQVEFSENESQVARDVATDWWDNAVQRDRLSWENAERLGVGIEVTQDGTVYATANVC
jgi:hypothetical protein